MTGTASLRRQALADMARTQKGDQGGRGRLGTILVALFAIGLVALIVLWFAGFFSTPAEVIALRSAVDTQMAQLDRMGRGEIPYSEDRSTYAAIFDTAKNVPEHYRERELGRFFRAQAAAEINSYFALPPAQRAAELDRRIKADEARLAKWEAERAQREASQGGGSRGNSNAASGGQAGSAPSGGPGRGPRTEDSRNARSKRFIDRTSADDRARWTEYRRARDQRRVSMGLPPSRW